MTPMLVIFDVDGTLVDSQHRIATAMTRAFHAHGLEAPSHEAVREIIGLSLVEAARQLAPGLGDGDHRAIAARYRDAFFEMRQHGEQEALLYDGAEHAVRALAKRNDIILGIATGKSRRGVNALIERHGFEHLFMTIQTADDHPSKPHPSMMQQAMAETGMNAAETVMIGDTRFDMAMAKAASVTGIGVAWGYHDRDDLAAAGAAVIADDYTHLIALIDQYRSWRSVS